MTYDLRLTTDIFNFKTRVIHSVFQFNFKKSCQF
jgi:hypothetical protein